MNPFTHFSKHLELNYIIMICCNFVSIAYRNAQTDFLESLHRGILLHNCEMHANYSFL